MSQTEIQHEPEHGTAAVEVDDGHEGSEGQDAPSRTMPPAKDPVGPGRITVLGVLLAVLVVALGVVLVHETLVAVGVASGTPWLESTASSVDGLRTATWVLPVAVVLLLLGLWLLWSALKPRPKTGVRLAATTGVYLRPRDVEKLVLRAVEDTDGVVSAKASAGRRKVDVRVEVTSEDGTAEQVRAAATDALASLDPTPTVNVKTTVHGDHS